MKKKIGELFVNAVLPEAAKFKSPLVLVHDLWSGAWCWQEWLNHFANLGWECWAVNFPGRSVEDNQNTLPSLTFDKCARDLKQVIQASPFPPVLVAHGFGGWVAQKALEEEMAAALILLSSPSPDEAQLALSPALRLLRLKYFFPILLNRPFRLQEKDFCKLWLASVPESRRPIVAKTMVPESSHLIREFIRPGIHLLQQAPPPTLLLGGSEDRVAPIVSLRSTAAKLGAKLLEYPNHGYWIMGEGEGERITRDIHRWIVQKLGGEILLADLSGFGRTKTEDQPD